MNKNISVIAYNVLNLPSQVTFSDGSTITYSYAADGTKLRTVHVISGTTTTRDYCANVVYENGVQKMLLTEEGYVDLSDNNTYYYYLKDHQGNNRVVIDKDAAVKETNHYYPFGSLFDSGNVQPYKYNGKELDTKKGLNWYDYGARHYDATLGRWFVVDPLAEKDYFNSPYSYCGNNPIVRVDQDGQIWETVWDIGNLLYDIGAAVVNHIKGNHEQAQTHWQDAGVDALAIAIPGLPAGISKLKYADDVVDVAISTNKIDNVKDATLKVQKNETARFVGDVDGKMIDIKATPQGTYIQPNGAETDVLGREHFNKIGGGKVESVGTSHTHNQGKNVAPNGKVYTFREDKAHIPTFEEIMNITNGKAVKK